MSKKTKVVRVFSIFLGVVLLLTLLSACGSSGDPEPSSNGNTDPGENTDSGKDTTPEKKNLSKEGVISEIVKNGQKVKNYHGELGIQVHQQQKSSGEKQNITSNTEIDFHEDTMDNHGSVKTNDDGKKAEAEFYTVGDKAYEKINDGEWRDVSAQKAGFQNTLPKYKDLIALIKQSKKELKMKKKNDTYVFTFKGKSEQIFNLFGKVYSISPPGVQPGDLEQEVKIVIDGKSFFIQEVQYGLNGSTNILDADFKLSHHFQDINKIGPITVPKKVKQA